MEEKIIHAEEEFTTDTVNEVDAKPIILGIHMLACMACLVGSKRFVNKHMDIDGICGSITKYATALAMGTFISSKLPFEKMAVKYLHEMLHKDKQEVDDGRKADNESGE